MPSKFEAPMNPAKFRLIATTQDYENYNFDDPEGAPYWKPKGGSDFLVAELNLAQAQRGREYLQNAVDCARPYIECNNAMFERTVVGYELLPPGELTTFEREQLEYEGKVRFHPTSVEALQQAAREHELPPSYADAIEASFRQASAEPATTLGVW